MDTLLIILTERSVFLVVRGNIRSVDTDSNLKAAVIKVSVTRVYQQKFALFPESGRLTRLGEIRTPLRCGVRPGAGSFLFTGRVHFGEAWLGCAPRYKDFLKVYEQAKQSLMIPCTLVNDWRETRSAGRTRWSEKLLSKWKRHWRRKSLQRSLDGDGHLKKDICVSMSVWFQISGPKLGIFLTQEILSLDIISLKYPKSSWCWRQLMMLSW